MKLLRMATLGKAIKQCNASKQTASWEVVLGLEHVMLICFGSFPSRSAQIYIYLKPTF